MARLSSGRHRAGIVWTPPLGSAMVSSRVSTPAGAEAARGRGSVGRASPCQGEGRGFESRRPLGASLGQSRRGARLPRWSGREARQRTANPCTRVQIPSPPRAIGAAVARFPDTEEVTGSNPVSPTSITPVSTPVTAVGTGPVTSGFSEQCSWTRCPPVQRRKPAVGERVLTCPDSPARRALERTGRTTVLWYIASFLAISSLTHSKSCCN